METKLICDNAANCDSEFCVCRKPHTQKEHPSHADYTKPLICVRYHKRVKCIAVGGD